MSTPERNRIQFFARPVAHVFGAGITGSMALSFLLIGIFADEKGRGALFFLAGVMIVFTLALYVPFVYHMRVILDPGGVIVRATGCKVSAAWEGVERFYRAHGPHYGLVAREPMSGKGVEKLRRYRFLTVARQLRYDEAELQWLEEGRYLPLQGFDHAVKSGALQRAIARFSPSLPGLDESPSGSPPERLKLKPWFWILLAVLIAAGVYMSTMPPEIRRVSDRIVGIIACGAGSARFAISAITLWSVKLRILSVLSGLLAVILALLALALLAPGH